MGRGSGRDSGEPKRMPPKQMATSILYPPLDFGKAETPVFHGVKRCQKRWFFHEKIGQTFGKNIEKMIGEIVLKPSF